MTLWVARSEKVKPALEWSASTSTCRDDAGNGTVALTLTLTTAFSQDTRVKVSMSGTGIYGLDWQFNPPKTHYTHEGILVPAGLTSFAVFLDINENLDPSETYIVTIEANANFYTIGSTSVHTLTCTAAKTRPHNDDYLADGYTGFNPTTCVFYLAGEGQKLETQYQKFEHTIVAGGMGITAPDCVVSDCWIQGAGVGNKYIGPESQAGVRCRLEHTTIGSLTSDGDDNTASLGRTGISSPTFNIYDWTASYCLFSRIHADATKKIYRGYFEYCLFERLGSDVNSHADVLQTAGSGDLGTVTWKYCYMRHVWERAAGYSGYTSGSAHKPWESNSMLQIDDGPWYGTLFWLSCWVDGGGETGTFNLSDNFDSATLRLQNCRMGNQNAAWTDATEPTQAAVMSKYGLDMNPPYSTSGCKWGGDYLTPSNYDSRAFSYNNKAAF